MKKIVFMSVIMALQPHVAMAEFESQSKFFDQIKQYCGKAFLGKVTVDNQPSDTFSNGELIMHVRKCNEKQLQVPFHVGKDASRTWLITKTSTGLSLKHDHRHEDGSEDKATMYGGHTNKEGWAQAQSFPADQYSKDLFIELGIPQSTGNTWHMYIYPEKFTYRLTREGREFRVDFDLSKDITPPEAPWGY